MKVSLNRHVIMIRMHYPTVHPDFPWRFKYFAAMCLPSLLKQKNQNFDIAIWCNSEHKKMFRELSDKIITFGMKKKYDGWIKPGYEHKAKENGGPYHIDFRPWEAVMGLKRYEFQTCIDSDDIMVSDNVIDAIEQMTFERPELSMHVSINPYIFHVPKLQTYACSFNYSIDKGSSIYSIYQPDTSKSAPFIFGYDDSHLIIGRQFEQRKFIKRSDVTVAFSVHEKNSSTLLRNTDMQVMI